MFDIFVGRAKNFTFQKTRHELSKSMFHWMELFKLLFTYLYAINRNVGKLWDAIYRGNIRFFSYCAITKKTCSNGYNKDK